MEVVALPKSKEIAWAQGEWDELGAWGRAVRIQAALYSARSSKAALADRLGVSDNTLGDWAFGDKGCDWSRWISVACALGLEGHELWRPDPEEVRHAEKVLDEMRPGLRKAPRLPVRQKEEGPPRKTRG